MKFNFYYFVAYLVTFLIGTTTGDYQVATFVGVLWILINKSMTKK